jgi:hypothetical protein
LAIASIRDATFPLGSRRANRLSSEAWASLVIVIPAPLILFSHAVPSAQENHILTTLGIPIESLFLTVGITKRLLRGWGVL